MWQTGKGLCIHVTIATHQNAHGCQPTVTVEVAAQAVGRMRADFCE